MQEARGIPGSSAAPEVEPWHIGIRREARLGKGGSPGSRFRALLLSTDYKQLYGEGPEGRVTKHRVKRITFLISSNLLS